MTSQPNATDQPASVLDLRELYNRRDALYIAALRAVGDSLLTAPERIAIRTEIDRKLWAANTWEKVPALCEEFEAVIRQYKPQDEHEGPIGDAHGNA